MKGKKAYREFLRTDFWKKLSALKKSMVKKCEVCTSPKNLQSHHVRYPADWFDTKLSDLQVLCRKCHRKTHGLPEVVKYPFLIHRDDVLFSAILHRIHCLNSRICKGGELRPRDISFLANANRMYPARPDDSCVEFQVGNVFLFAELMSETKIEQAA